MLVWFFLIRDCFIKSCWMLRITLRDVESSVFIFPDLLEDEDEIDEHQPFPSLSQVTDFIRLQCHLLLIFTPQWNEWFCSAPRCRSSKLFPNTSASTSSSNGSARWGWVFKSKLKSNRMYHRQNSLTLWTRCSDRTAHGTANYRLTSTWIVFWTSFWEMFCRKPETDASFSPVLTQTSAPCECTYLLRSIKLYMGKKEHG